jgi:hypothetical protein
MKNKQICFTVLNQMKGDRLENLGNQWKTCRGPHKTLE